MKMAYQRTGGPIISWASGYPPRQSRAGETTGLGDNYVPSVPMPGAPERISTFSGTMDAIKQAYPVLSVVSGAASAYHGYKRNGSIGWAIAWGLLGGMAPIITPAIAVAQGFGKKK